MPYYQTTEPRTWWEALWDGIRGVFVVVVYALIDGVVRLVENLIRDAVYGNWREEFQ